MSTLYIRIYGIVSDNDFNLSYKIGETPGNHISGFTSYGTTYDSSTTEITITGLTYDTQYWFKIEDAVNGSYSIENIKTYSQEYYNLICEIAPYDNIDYGLLYNWYAAAQPQSIQYGYLYNAFALDGGGTTSIAANGWHVPTSTEFNTLATYLGGTSVAGGHIKATGTTYWLTPNTGADNSAEFNARGVGQRETNGSFTGLQQVNRFWTSTTISSSITRIWQLLYNSDDFITPGGFYNEQGLTVRLVKDSTTLSDGETSIYVGNDGRVYKTICIGTQEWLSENLMETMYRDLSAIPEVTDTATWAGLSTGARCSYNNTETNAIVSTEIANTGWHVPSNTEYEALTTYLGGNSVAGGKLKEIGFLYWNSPNTGATNEVGFNLRGSGRRTSSFVSKLQYAGLWTTTSGATTAWERQIVYNQIYDNPSFGQKYYGQGIRLIKDSTTLTHGQSGTYTGNDGKIYRTICIGTQEWLADNLAETKYRDGSLIPEITDNTDWTNLTTGGMCAYNNDWNYV